MNADTREPRDGVNDSCAVGGYAERGGERGVGDVFSSPLIRGNEGTLVEGSCVRIVGELGVDFDRYLPPLVCWRLISAITFAR